MYPYGKRSFEGSFGADTPLAKRGPYTAVARTYTPIYRSVGVARRGRSAGFAQRYSNTRSTGLRPELKAHDTTLTGTISATGGVLISSLNVMQQGDTGNTRDGREVVIKSIQIRGTLTFSPAAAVTASGVTLLYLILDKTCAGTNAGITTIMDGTNLNTNLSNLDNSERFTVLKKWVIAWNSMAGVTTAYNNQTKIIDWYKKVNIKTQFDATTGALTDVTTANLAIYAGATSNVDNMVVISGVARIRFYG